MIVRPIYRSQDSHPRRLYALGSAHRRRDYRCAGRRRHANIFEVPEGANEDVAYTKIKNIEKAAMAIQISVGSPPQSLAEMTQASDGGRPAIDDADVSSKDPWGKEFKSTTQRQE